MSKAVRTIVAGAGVAALTLTGCTQPPSAAATVNGVQIPDAVARRTAQVLASATGSDESTTARQGTYDLVMGEASRQIAAANGVVVDGAKKADILAKNPAAQAIAASVDGAAWGDAVSTAYVVIDTMGEQEYAQKLAEQKIEVNPRYGTWSPQRFTMVDSSLSRPASGQQG